VEALHRRSPRQARHRDDLTLNQQYMADIARASRKRSTTVDYTPYFAKYRQTPEKGGVQGRPGRDGRERPRTRDREVHRRASQPPTSSPRARPSRCCSPSGSTSATARGPPVSKGDDDDEDLGVWKAEDCALVADRLPARDVRGHPFRDERRHGRASRPLLAKTAKAFDMPIVLSTVGVELGFNARPSRRSSRSSKASSRSTGRRMTRSRTIAFREAVRGDRTQAG